MIIISQNKKEIVIFENVSKLYINIDAFEEFTLAEQSLFSADQRLQKIEKIEIKARLINDRYCILGMYKTEERAKEVIQEIIDAVVNWENFKVGIPCKSIIPSFKYELPLE